MIKLILICLCMCFTSCDPPPREYTRVIDGHTYIWECSYRSKYIHDPECGKCQELDL